MELGKRIILIGCCGSGKSTLAKQLAKQTKLPLIHLDRVYYKPNWEPTPRLGWEQIQEELTEANEWIIDGNYNSTMDIRMRKTDTIIFLDFNKFVCTYRVIKRSLMNREKVRSDMGIGCKERIDWNFIKFVWSFNKTSRPKIYTSLEQYNDKNIHVLKNSKEVKAFIDCMKGQNDE